MLIIEIESDILLNTLYKATEGCSTCAYEGIKYLNKTKPDINWHEIFTKFEYEEVFPCEYHS